MQRQANGLLKCGNCSFTSKNPSTMHYHRQFMGHPPARYADGDLQGESEQQRSFAGKNTDNNLEFQQGHASGKDYKCRRCDYRSANRDNALRHVRCHTGERPHACTTCGMRFSRADRLKEHMECHANRRRLQCEHCNYTANHPSTMRNHRKRHLRSQATDGKRYDGTSSSNSPSTPPSSSTGTESIEESDGWFEMESVEIDDGYIGPEQTPSAEPAVTKVEEETVASSPKAAGLATDIARRKCPICRLPWKSVEHLKRHMLVHTQHERAVCTTCGNVYRDNDSLRKHMVIHSGERPFACPECDFTARRRHELTLHQRRHTGEMRTLRLCSPSEVEGRHSFQSSCK